MRVCVLAVKWLKNGNDFFAAEEPVTNNCVQLSELASLDGLPNSWINEIGSIEHAVVSSRFFYLDSQRNDEWTF